MKVDIKGNLDSNTDLLCAWVGGEIQSLRGLIETIHIDPTLGKTTQQIQKQLNPKLELNGWILNFTYDANTISTSPSANYHLNAIKDVRGESCKHMHRLLLELCFDNRQAIGTNLLKFETAKRLFEKNTSCLTTSIIICGSQDALLNLKWDGGVASYSEYENALMTVYKDIFTFSPCYLVIKSQ
jgi:hypothetical protein